MPMWNSFLGSCPCGMQWLAEVWLGLPRTLPRASYHGQVEPSNLCVGFFLKTRGLTCALRGLLASSEDVFNKWCLPKSNGNVQTACKLKFLVFLVVPEKKHRHVPLNLSNPVPGLSLDDGLFVDYAADAGADWLPIARKEGFVGQTQTCYADAQGVWSLATGARAAWTHIDRRKFRSQTSDNMDRWKAELAEAERRGE